MIFSKKIQLSLLFCILFFAAALRLYAVNWDNNSHMHPDERAITIAVVDLNLPSSMSEFLSPQSPWNPHFFAYGSFPFYLLKILGFSNPSLSTYDGLALLGRVLSAVFDLGTIVLLFFLGKHLKNVSVGLIGAAFYTLATLPIQLSHFYAVDTPLTFFTTLFLLLSLRVYEKPSWKKSLCLGIVFGLALATKVSAIVLLVSFGVAICAEFVLLFLRQPHRPKIWLPHIPIFLKRLGIDLLFITIATIITYAIFEPYAVLDTASFWKQTLDQSAMTKDAFIFPYTLQYVGKVPYFYELKNVFLYGLGPLLATICLAGTIYVTCVALLKEKTEKWAQELILISFFWSYFFVVGGFAIGFMRYMLPLYPLLCLFGALLTYRLFISLKQKMSYPLLVVSCLLIAVGLFIWPLSFIKIYTRPNTRIQATDWIKKNIPPGSSLAIEHWDDSLPLNGQENYTMLTLPLYDPDTPEKWLMVNQTLSKTDYIILASNRLYTPLQKLTDCAHLPVYRCYPQTADYYKNLFSGKLGYKKVAEFTSYPTIPLLNFKINDQPADESFTVYDHPKIMIFKKE